MPVTQPALTPDRSTSPSPTTEFADGAVVRYLLLAVLQWSTQAAAQNIASSGALSFGAVAAGGGGSVTLSPSGARSRTGGVMLFAQGGSAAAVQLTVEARLAPVTPSPCRLQVPSP